MSYSVLYHRLDVDKLDLETYYYFESGYLYYMESNKQTNKQTNMMAQYKVKYCFCDTVSS